MLGSAFKSIALGWNLFLYRIRSYFLSHHLPLKILFAVLRRVRPISVFGKVVIVTKASDVREVLDRFDDFTLNEIIGPGMPWGPFLMTVDWREQHMQERQLLQSMVVPATDIEMIGNGAARRCQKQIEQATIDYAERGQIDVVAELAEPVAVVIAETYFGVPAIDRNEPELARIMANLASTIMVPPPEGSRRWTESRNSIVTLTEHLRELIQAKKCVFTADPAHARPNELLGRLVQRLCAGGPDPKWFDEGWIRRYITGLIGTGGATIVRATTQTVDRLIAHPAALRRAQRLAARLDQDEQAERSLSGRADTDREKQAAKSRVEESRRRLRQIVYEAHRFRPMLPLLVRYSPRGTIIAKGTKRARMVPAGARVIAGPLAAMYDPEAFEMPWRFCSSRPLEDFVHFGHGDRVCFGKYVADTAMLEIVRSLLRLPDLERAAGLDGRVRYDGPVARSLVVTFQRNATKSKIGKKTS